MYPKEMQIIVQNFYEKNNYSMREVANIFNISKSSIHRWINVSNKKVIKKINYEEKIKQIIKSEIKRDCFVTIKNLTEIIKKKLNIKISQTGVYVHTIKNGFSFKKIAKRIYNNLENIKNRTKEFIKIVKKMKLSEIVCIDESGIFSNMCNNFGWSKKGTKIIKYIKSHPKKYSLIMAISKEKIISNEIHEKNINGEIFYNYLKNKLLPQLKGKYILMDNIAFHKSQKIQELIKNSSNKILFIPPYSPDFNPIENVFHIVKSKIRSNKKEINIETIKEAINDIKINFRKIYKNSLRKVIR